MLRAGVPPWKQDSTVHRHSPRVDGGSWHRQALRTHVRTHTYVMGEEGTLWAPGLRGPQGCPPRPSSAPPARARSRRPRRLTPAPFSILRLAGSLPRTDPKVCPRPQRLSPLGVSRTLLPERRRHSLIGAQLSVPGKKRSSDWPRRLRTSESGEAWPCLPGGSAPEERTSAGSPLPRARELAPALEVGEARFC